LKCNITTTVHQTQIFRIPASSVLTVSLHIIMINWVMQKILTGLNCNVRARNKAESESKRKHFN